MIAQFLWAAPGVLGVIVYLYLLWLARSDDQYRRERGVNGTLAAVVYSALITRLAALAACLAVIGTIAAAKGFVLPRRWAITLIVSVPWLFVAAGAVEAALRWWYRDRS